MSKVGVYLRISEDKDGEQTATDRQRKDCMKFAKGRGFTVADTFEDIDLSAFKKTVKRPEFERMLEAVRTGAIDGVLAWKIDRITRRQRDLVRLDEACEEAGGFICTVTENIDTRQPTGRFVAELLVAQARMESENSALRQRRKQQEMAQEGRPNLGGSRLFGYTLDRKKIIASEAKLIREGAKRVLAGEGIRGICYDWKRRGYVTTMGGPWQASPFKRLLTSPALSGQREHNGVLTAGQWPAILTPDDTRRLRAVLNDPNRLKVVNPRRYLLTGMMRCGLCGQNLIARPTGTGVRRYVCGRQPGNDCCGKIARVAEPVEAFVKEAVCIALDGADLRTFIDMPTDDTGELLDAIRVDEESLTQLSKDHYVDRCIDRAEYFAARDGINARLEQNRHKLSQTTGRGTLDGVIGAGDEVRRQWDERGLDWQRAIIAAVVDHVVLEPARKGYNVFDPSLVKITWRF